MPTHVTLAIEDGRLMVVDGSGYDFIIEEEDETQSSS